MKKLLTQTTTLIALLLCMVTTSACFDDEEDNHDPQTESNLVGVWQGHSDPLAEWRIEFCPDGTARVTQYALDFGEYDVWIVQDYHFNSWKAHNGNFYIGDYYDGRILSDKSISLNSRLVGTDGEVIFVTLYKTTEDNFPAILDHQERARKLIGIWEGMGDDGTYARRLELEHRVGLPGRKHLKHGPVLPVDLLDVEIRLIPADHLYCVVDHRQVAQAEKIHF